MKESLYSMMQIYLSISGIQRSGIVIACLIVLAGCATPAQITARKNFDSRSHQFDGFYTSDDRSFEKKEPDGTLESYIAYAMENSAELKAQFERWQASIYRISKTRRLPEPVINYAYYVSSVETRVGAQRHKVSLKQSFPWPTKLSAGADAACAKADSAEKRFDALAISIAAAVEREYWTIWELGEKQKVNEEHTAILGGLSESVAAQVMIGNIDLADQQQIDLTQARTEDLISTVNEQIIRAAARLKGIIGAPQSMIVRVKSQPAQPHTVVHEKQWVEWVRSHPYIYSYKSLALASEFEAEQEGASRYPNFSMGVDWIETGKTNMPDVADSGKDALIVGVGISIPLWQRSYKESVAAYRADMGAHLAEGEAAQNDAVARFYAILSDVRDAKRKIELYKGTLVPQANSVFESVLGAYASGRGNVASIVLAQRDLLDLRVQLIGAQSDYLRSWASLQNVIGRDIDTQELKIAREEVNP